MKLVLLCLKVLNDPGTVMLKMLNDPGTVMFEGVK